MYSPFAVLSIHQLKNSYCFYTRTYKGNLCLYKYNGRNANRHLWLHIGVVNVFSFSISVYIDWQGSVLGIEVDAPGKSYTTQLISTDDEMDTKKVAKPENEGFVKPHIFTFTIPQVMCTLQPFDCNTSSWYICSYPT